MEEDDVVDVAGAADVGCAVALAAEQHGSASGAQLLPSSSGW